MKYFIFCILIVSLVSTAYAEQFSPVVANVYIVDTFYKSTNKMNLRSDNTYTNSNTSLLERYELKKTKERYYIEFDESEFFSFPYNRAQVGATWKSGAKTYTVDTISGYDKLLTISLDDKGPNGCFDGVRTSDSYFSFDLDAGLMSSVRLLEDCKTAMIVGSVTYSFHW